MADGNRSVVIGHERTDAVDLCRECSDNSDTRSVVVVSAPRDDSTPISTIEDRLCLPCLGDQIISLLLADDLDMITIVAE